MSGKHSSAAYTTESSSWPETSLSVRCSFNLDRPGTIDELNEGEALVNTACHQPLHVHIP